MARTYRLGLQGTLCLTLSAAIAAPACARQDAAQRDAYASYAAGDYDLAIRSLQGLVRGSPDDVRARRTLVAALVDVGRYEDAETTARASQSPELANSLGEVLVLRGRPDEATVAFRRAVEGRAADANTARLNLALIDLEHGRQEQALDQFDAFIDIYNQSETLSPRDLIAVGEAVRRLGVRDPQLFQDAVKALDEAIRADDGRVDGRPAGQEARIRMGFLFLEKYNSQEAQPLFREVLEQNEKQPRALLGMAMARNFEGSDESMVFVDQSLEVNPNSVEALTFRARLLLDLERREEARADIDKALQIDPRSLDALSTLAASQFLAGDEAAYTATRDSILRLNPLNADHYNQVAELAVRQRRYRGAVDLAVEAVRIDPRSYTGWGILGLNQLRLGQVDEARRNLETSFEGDPYNPWIKNTLDLLDTFGEYRVVRSPRFELMLHQNEADLIAPYMQALAEEAYDTLTKRYGYTPELPIRIEVYPRHADFSVRTVGLAGLGALGVCFGNVLAMDSPAAHERGQFNWGTTLWHELAHTMTLGVSEHRVPRWLTEGLSVLEERRARTGWGDDLTPDFIAAYERGDVLPVSRLNAGFVRPKYPQQVGFSYYQASLIAEFIEQEKGFDAILRMLRGYADGRTDREVFRDVLGEDIEAFDKRFDAWFKQRYEKQLASVDAPREGGILDRAMGAMRGGEPPEGDFMRQLARANELIGERRNDEAKPYLERAKALFPEYAGPGNPYSGLAGIHMAAGDTAAAMAELDALAAINENDYDANFALARLRNATGNARAAAGALERAIWISPYDKTLHEQLAELYVGLNDAQGLVRARRALVALDPVDRAEALYQLALALQAAGDNAAARREVVRALEIAPNFQKAQELLLSLRGRDGPDSEAIR
jgi:tetratricopeptide (TPR) repeat protein